MINIQEKTLKDLEFNTVLNQISQFCSTDLGKNQVLQILPFKDKEALLNELNLTNEYLSSFYNENRIPSHNFEPITKEIRLLNIDNSYLETSSFKKIEHISSNCNTILNFLKKFSDYYPTLHQNSSSIEITKVLIEQINLVIDRFGDVKDNASSNLLALRQSITSIKAKFNQSFATALNYYNGLDYLDDIRESVIENKRVLAVKAMYRRKVKGNIMGSSKTGSITYVEPETTFKFARELNNLEFEEQEELIKILKNLSNFIRPYKELLSQYQSFLTDLDVICAKAKYAQAINAILPNINNEKVYDAIDAFHPILYLSNKKKGIKTFSQSIKLNSENRIIVISGPNAGGKSITLKTI
jgi:DNA mismatch repair protein MutS2